MKFYKYSTGDFVMRHKIIDKSQILKKFFWKKYSYKTGTNYEFRDDSILLRYPNPDVIHRNYEKDAEKMIHEFTKEDMELWFKVAEIRFGKSVYTIKRDLASLPVIGRELVNKFPEFFQEFEPKPEIEPDPNIIQI